MKQRKGTEAHHSFLNTVCDIIIMPLRTLRDKNNNNNNNYIVKDLEGHSRAASTDWRFGTCMKVSPTHPYDTAAQLLVLDSLVSILNNLKF